MVKRSHFAWAVVAASLLLLPSCGSSSGNNNCGSGSSSGGGIGGIGGGGGGGSSCGGSSSDMCSPSDPNNVCLVCLAKNCCSQAEACAGDTKCEAIVKCQLACIASGKSGPVCAPLCIDDSGSSTARTQATAFDYCILGNCSNVCVGASDAGAD